MADSKLLTICKELSKVEFAVRNDLHEKTGITKAHLDGLISHGVRKGLIAKVKVVGTRNVKYSLTDNGRAYIKKGKAKVSTKHFMDVGRRLQCNEARKFYGLLAGVKA